MKIKNSVDINEKPVICGFAAVTVAALSIRFYQLICMIDSETGFYKYKNPTIYLLYGLIALVCVCLPVAMYLKKQDDGTDDFYAGVNKPVGAAGIICAVAFFIDFIQSILTAAVLNSENVGTGNITGMKAFMKTGALPTLIQGFLAIPCTVYFLILGICFIKGSTKYQNRKILALMPVGWGVMRMIRRFVRQISFQNVSDLFLELILISFLVIFLMAFAQLASGVYNEGVKWRITGFGLPAAALCFITAFPRFIFLVTGMSGKYINSYHPFYACDLALGIFIVALVIFARKSNMPATENETDTQLTLDGENTDVS